MREAFAIYLANIFWCLPSLFIFFVLQRYWQARNRVMPFTIIILSANVLNLLACVALGLGKWGFPAFGIRGIAWATNLSRYAMVVAALIYSWRQQGPTRITVPVFDRAIQRRFFSLGLPAASHTALEIGAFTIATFIVGTLGSVPLAAHHVCLMMAAFTFMFPLRFLGRRRRAGRCLYRGKGSESSEGGRLAGDCSSGSGHERFRGGLPDNAGPLAPVFYQRPGSTEARHEHPGPGCVISGR